MAYFKASGILDCGPGFLRNQLLKLNNTPLWYYWFSTGSDKLVKTMSCVIICLVVRKEESSGEEKHGIAVDVLSLVTEKGIKVMEE
jgi:hypothetical protein